MPFSCGCGHHQQLDARLRAGKSMAVGGERVGGLARPSGQAVFCSHKVSWGGDGWWQVPIEFWWFIGLSNPCGILEGYIF